ncbi:hypothetical protein [Brevibacterium zhoupengii]|uniref:hypothetical protein n=1 Tax=Brevibacterium zhoupengii TaxID=2898795 RepID=UPI001F09D553|nr:hypothetical protein [Brevibacterium zhoupengii]
MNIAANDNENIDIVRHNVARVVDDVSTTNAELAKELLTAYDRESKLLGGIRKRESEIAKLKAQVAARDAKLASVNERLDRLLRSKAMQVQRAYWRLRRPASGGARREGTRK